MEADRSRKDMATYNVIEVFDLNSEVRFDPCGHLETENDQKPNRNYYVSKFQSF